MSGPPAAAIQVSPAQQDLLQRIVRQQTADQGLARQLRLTRLTVRHWRDRWREATPCLQQAEQDQVPEPQLRALLEQVLGDAPRPGAPATFSPEQIVQL